MPDIRAQWGDEAARTLAAIVESSDDAIIAKDLDGTILSWNGGAERIYVERLFGFRASELIGQNVSILMPSPDGDAHDQYLANYHATGVAKIIGIGREVTGKHQDGTTFPLHLSVGEMVIGGERRFTGILHDLTARVKAEEQLREQAALVRLGEMAAVIAHEVRNPLAAVRGALQVVGKRLPVEGREAAVVIDIIARLDALNRLVQDLLLFARPPRPNVRSVDLSALLSLTALLVGADAAYRDIHVVVAGDSPWVAADAELLKIVFLNLFLNSAQAMRGKGTIAVSLAGVDGRCRIAVADTGPGIPPEIRAKLFTPFVTTKSRGTGLGLSTVKRLVEAHGGTIEMECPPEGGTIAALSLPLAAP